MGNTNHNSLTIQLHLNEPEDIKAIERELELFKATVGPPYHRLIVGPFNGFHELAYTIFVVPHGCKDKHTDIVEAHADTVNRLRLLAHSWGSGDSEISVDAVEVVFNSSDPELVDVRVDPLPGWTLSKERIQLDDHAIKEQ